MSFGIVRFFSGGTPLKGYLNDILKAIQSYPAFPKDVQTTLNEKDSKFTRKHSSNNANVRNVDFKKIINFYHPILEYMVSGRTKGDHKTLHSRFLTEHPTIIRNCDDALAAYKAKEGNSAKSDTQKLCKLLPTVNAKIADYFSLHEPPSSILANALAASKRPAGGAGVGPLPSRQNRVAAAAAPPPAAPVVSTNPFAAAAPPNLPPAVVSTNPFAAAAALPPPPPAPPADPVVITNPFAAAAAAAAPPLLLPPAANNPFESPEAIAAEEAIARAAEDEAVEAERTAFAIELGVKAMADFKENSKANENRVLIAGMQPPSEAKRTMNRTAQKNRGLELIAAMQKDKKKFLAAARKRLTEAEDKRKARAAEAAKESSAGHYERARILGETVDHYERIKIAQQKIIDAYEKIKDKPEIEVIKNPLAAALPAAPAAAPAAPPTVGIAKPTGCLPGGCFPWGRKTRRRQRRLKRKQTRRQR